MKWYHWVLFGLKFVFLLQFLIILSGKYKIDKRIYLATEILFKIFLSLYIQYIMFFSKIPDIEFEDNFIITFASGLLLYDACYNDIPEFIELYTHKETKK